MQALTFSRSDWWSEIGAYAEQERIPFALQSLLRGLVNAVLNGTVRPTHRDHEVALLREHLAAGVVIDGRPYQPMLFVPDNPATHRQFVDLVPAHYVGGRLVPLCDPA